MNTKIFVMLDTDLFSNRKVVECSPLARLEYIVCLCLAKTHYETDGTVTPTQAWHVQPEMSQDDHAELFAELVKHGLLEEYDDGFQIVGWLDHNPSAEDVELNHAERIRAGRAGGAEAARRRRQLATASATAPATASATADPIGGAVPREEKSREEKRQRRGRGRGHSQTAEVRGQSQRSESERANGFDGFDGSGQGSSAGVPASSPPTDGPPKLYPPGPFGNDHEPW